MTAQIIPFPAHARPRQAQIDWFKAAVYAGAAGINVAGWWAMYALIRLVL